MRSLHFIGIVVLIVAGGFVHGMWTQRWNPPESIETKPLLQFGDFVGEWKPGDFIKINPADMPAHVEMVTRRFDCPSTNKTMAVSITSGLPGIVSVHTPDICYLGTGYQLKTAVRQETIPLEGNRSAQFYVADFQKGTGPAAEMIRVRWAWTVHGDWKAPNYPRWHFAGSPILYKLYLVHSLREEEDLTRADPYRKFLAELVPALSRQLGN